MNSLISSGDAKITSARSLHHSQARGRSSPAAEVRGDVTG